MKITPSKRNTNRHTDKGMQLLEKSINEVGVIESISVTKEGTIISGHARKATFDKQGKKPKEIHLSENEYPVIVRDDIEDDTELYYKAQILANTTSKQNIDLDTELIEEIAVEYDLDIEELGVDVLEDTETHLEAEEDDFDATPPEEPITVLGDLYEIGEHRLLCGDSTDSDQVAKLMNGEKADMVFTDPPYNISFSGSMSNTTKDGVMIKHKGANQQHEIIKNDAMSDEEFYTFMSDILKEIKINCIGAFYICFGSQTLNQLLQPFLDLGLEYKSIIIWMKNQATLSGKDYKGRYEPIVYGRFNDGFYGERFKQEDIWEFQRTLKNDLHPTMKPIPLIENALNNSSKIGMNILDLFLGSGSTMVASHQLKRKCYGMELDPKYCDVIVRRMAKLDPTLTIKRNGVVTTDFNETK